MSSNEVASPGIVLFQEEWEMLRDLDNDTKSFIIEAIYNYHYDGIEPEPTTNMLMKMTWMHFKSVLDKCQRSYATKASSNQRKVAGALNGFYRRIDKFRADGNLDAADSEMIKLAEYAARNGNPTIRAEYQIVERTHTGAYETHTDECVTHTERTETKTKAKASLESESRTQSITETIPRTETIARTDIKTREKTESLTFHQTKAPASATEWADRTKELFRTILSPIESDYFKTIRKEHVERGFDIMIDTFASCCEEHGSVNLLKKVSEQSASRCVDAFVNDRLKLQDLYNVAIRTESMGYLINAYLDNEESSANNKSLQHLCSGKVFQYYISKIGFLTAEQMEQRR